MPNCYNAELRIYINPIALKADDKPYSNDIKQN